jgi:hypothetical protein
VYVVLVVGETLVLVLSATRPMPLMFMLVAFVVVQERVAELPEVIVEGLAERLQVGALGIKTKAAVQILLLFIVTVPEAEQSPPQPVKVEPGEAVAVSVRFVPLLYWPLQLVFCGGQLNPVVVTVPVPLPNLLTMRVRITGAGVTKLNVQVADPPGEIVCVPAGATPTKVAPGGPPVQ